MKLPISCSLCEVTLLEAATRLGVHLHELTVYCGFGDQLLVRRLAAIHAFAYVLVPDEILRVPNMGTRWGVSCSRGVVWSDQP